MMQKQFSIAMTAVCLILGIMIGMQYHSVKYQKMTMENQRLSEATVALNQMKAERDALQAQKEALEQTIKEYQDGTVDAEVEKILQFAGLTTVSGSGVIVTMNDSSKSGADKNAYLVHAEDLLAVVNELYAAGAEAVSVNGQRMINRSAITCAGSIVMVNGVRVAAPFEIRAIGEADILQAALFFPGGVVDNLSPWGIEVIVNKQENVEVPAYTQSALFQIEKKEE